MINGNTVILFVRRTEFPNIPYFTVEYKSEKVTQCRGMRNEAASEEIKQLLDEWLKWMKNGRKKPKKRVVATQRAIA